MKGKIKRCPRCENRSCLGVGGNAKCPKCGTLNCYSEKYDAYFCSGCNKWLEGKCKDKHCGFCSKRPDKPIK